MSNSMDELPGAREFAVAEAGFLDLPQEHRQDATARFAVIPVPYDMTSTWQRGADHGPAALFGASVELEWYDTETDSVPSTAGIITRSPVLCSGSPDELRAFVKEAVLAELQNRKLPVVIGGEHSVSIGAIDAAAAHCGGTITTVQIDAHGDTRESYQGSSCNHACVMARAREHGPIVQVGLRAIAEEEVSRMNRARTLLAHEMAGVPRKVWTDRLATIVREACAGGSVYLTIDLDAFDSGVMPATGTPEPGGLSWHDMTAAIDAITSAADVVAFDVVELCPRPGLHACDFVAAKLVHRVMASLTRLQR
ncbi:MAG: agmatinase [Planctomycetota bacterium]